MATNEQRTTELCYRCSHVDTHDVLCGAKVTFAFPISHDTFYAADCRAQVVQALTAIGWWVNTDRGAWCPKHAIAAWEMSA